MGIGRASVFLAACLSVAPQARVGELAASAPAWSSSQTDAGWPPPGVHPAKEDGVAPPRLVRQVKPNYTDDALREKIQGVVVLECVVQADGTVGDVRVARSLDRVRGLDEEAIKAAKQWRFAPGTKDGVAIPVLITIQLTFTFRAAPNPDHPAGWPPLFTGRPTATETWTEHTVDVSGLHIVVSQPAEWTVSSSPTAVFAARRVTKHSVQLVEVRPPTQTAFPVRGPVSAQFLADAAERTRQSIIASGRDVDVRGSGQMRIGTHQWLWTDLWLPMDGSTAASLPNVPPALVRAIDGIRSWVFVTTEGDENVQATFTLLVPRGGSAGERDADVKAAGVTFGEMLRRLKIEPRRE